MTYEEEREWQEQTTYGRVLTVPPIHAALIKRLRMQYHCLQPIG